MSHRVTTPGRAAARRGRIGSACAAALAVVTVLAPSLGASGVSASGPDAGTDAAADLAARQDLVSEIGQAVGGAPDVVVDPQTGLVSFVGGGAGEIVPDQGPAVDPQAAAVAFLDRNADALGVTGRHNALVPTATVESLGTGASVRFQQEHDGVPIMGGEVQVSVGDSGAARAVVSDLAPSSDVSTDPAVTAADARATALGVTAKHSGANLGSLDTGDGELWIYNNLVMGGPGDGLDHLVWRFEVTSTDDAVRQLILVDAQLGVVALDIDQLAEARTRRVCDWHNSVTADNVCTAAEAERVEGGPASGISEVNTAYTVSGHTYDFFSSRFGRDSWNGSGAVMYSNTRFCDDPGSCPLANAFWSGAQIHLGDGFAAADDVVAHEWGHAYTEHTSNLFYYYQSGAINEAYSDIWGEFVDQTNGFGTDTAGVKWLMGEDVPGFGAIRNMKDPTTFSDPDRMLSGFYYSSTGDSGGVHTNSGVLNKAAYLLSDGATFNSVTVSGIGLDKAARVFWEAQSTLLTSASDYQDLDTALVVACNNLIGTGGITVPNCTEVSDATDATQMQLLPAGSLPNAPECTSGTKVNIWTDDFENPAAGKWTKSTSSTPGDVTTRWYIPQEDGPGGGFLGSSYATSGDSNAWGYNGYTEGVATLQMAAGAPIPAGSSAFIRFNHAYDFEAPNWDGGVLEYSVNGGSWVDAGSKVTHNGYSGTINGTDTNPFASRSAYIGSSHGMTSTRVNVTTLAGNDVRFRFRIGTDSSFDWYGWFIDDFELFRCRPAGVSDCDPGRPGPFWDVPRTSTFCEDIEWLADEGVTGGFADSGFHPGASVSRQSMAAFLYRYAGSPAFTPPGTPSFDDVPKTHAFYKEIEWLASTGVTGGFADGGFHPTAPVTRQSMAAFLYRFAGSPAFSPPGSPTFNDVPTGQTFYKEIEWLASTDVTGGYPDGGFHPGSEVSRQAMAAFLHRFDDLP